MPAFRKGIVQNAENGLMSGVTDTECVATGAWAMKHMMQNMKTLCLRWVISNRSLTVFQNF